MGFDRNSLIKDKKVKTGIYGCGMVGSAMQYLFPDSVVYDLDIDKCSLPKPNKYEGLTFHTGVNNMLELYKKELNDCDVVFICVPTNGNDEGYDYQALREAIDYLDVPIVVIKSTVQPGTSQWLQKRTKSDVVFSPEFLREKYRFKDIDNETRIILGTQSKQTFELLRSLYFEVYDPDKVEVLQTEPMIAEFVKLINNSFLATKVTFCNEVKRIVNKHNIDYEEIRRLWLTDKRIGQNHTIVTKEGGFSGYCFPKDLRAMINTAEKLKYEPEFLKSVWNNNCKFRKDYNGKEY